MPTFTLELLPDEPILVLTTHADYSATRDLSESNPAVYNMLEAATEPVNYILDARQTRFTITDLIQIATAMIRGSMPTLTHPNVRQAVIVTTNRTVKTAATTLGSAALRTDKKIKITDTLDEALAYCRQQ